MAISQIPAVRITVDGAQISPSLAVSLSNVRVQQKLSLPAQCELVFTDPADPAQAAAAFAPGAALSLSVAGQEEALFEGEITVRERVYGPSAQAELRVRAYDLLHRLRKYQALRTFSQSSLSGLAQQLTSEAGLGSVQIEGEDPEWPVVIQSGQTNFDLLRLLGEKHGLYLTARGADLLLVSLNGTGEAENLVLGQSLVEARVEVSGEAACDDVQAAGWHPLTVEGFSADASQARAGRDITEQVSASAVHGAPRRELGNAITPDRQHAEGLAQADLDRRSAHAVTLWGVAEGNPRLRPGTPVNVERLDADTAGTYTLTSATHTIDSASGYLTEFSTLPPAPADRPRGSGASLGVVSSVADPSNLGRVRVRLPALGDIESAWMHVLSPAAGRDKGLTALPDIDDTVLVLFPLEEPGQGIVLGGLYGLQGPPDSGVEGDQVLRYTFRTRGGQRVILDDGHHKIHLEDSNGSIVDLSPDKVLIHAAVDLYLEAPGKHVIIQGQNIDFRRA